MSAPSLKIGNRTIGEGRPVYIIAEAGVNHNGDMDTALRMIREAAKAGVDAVKFQTFITERGISRSAKKAEYQMATGKEDSQFDMVKRLELPFESFDLLRKECEEQKIEFLSTPFDLPSLDYLVGIGMRAIKVPSGELNNLPFLEAVIEKGLPVLLSTGMAELSEVDLAWKMISARCPMAILQCTTNYPADYDTMNLRVITAYQERYGIPIGLSDHSPGIVAPVVAVALGANIIEKHFTLDKDMPGPDHRASLDIVELKEMVSAVRNAERSLGNGIKRPFQVERDIAGVARKSIVSAVKIPQGAIITREMVEMKRPGTGITPDLMAHVLGRRAKRTIEEDCMLTWEDLE